MEPAQVMLGRESKASIGQGILRHSDFMLRCLSLSILSSIFFLSIHAQHSISGTVTDESGQALMGAVVSLDGGPYRQATDGAGRFLFSDLESGSYELTTRYLGMQSDTSRIEVEGDLDLDIQLVNEPFLTDEVVITATRAGVKTPMAYTDMSMEELAPRNIGLDIPELLHVAPSMLFTSDAGNGIGYSYLRLRGQDQTNVNVTINGVPLNDSESQGVFWVNLPDITSSSQSIQIQRGVGTSVNGAGAFGGSINMQTDASTDEAYASMGIGAGSFNTQRLSVQAGTGLMNDHWTLDTRLSFTKSDGFIDRSAADLKGYYLAGGYRDKRTNIRLIAFGGREETQQAWFGVPRGRFEDDEASMLAFAADNGFTDEETQLLLDGDSQTYNYYTYDNEIDRYGQDHVQLHISRSLNEDLLLNLTGHYTRGAGFFEQFRQGDDYADYLMPDPVFGGDTLTSADFIRRRWLDNDFYGAIASLQWRKGPWNSVLGGGWNRYEGDHFGEVVWASVMGDVPIRHRYYEDEATKTDANIYWKTDYGFAKGWNAFVDLQTRWIDYELFGLQENRAQFRALENDFDFFNPKLGLTYSPSARQRAFISYAVANKEPNRDDHVNSDPGVLPTHQTLYDLELGYRYRAPKWTAEVVLYDMQFKDQLIATGEVNDVGELIRTNVPESCRRGIELIASWRPNDFFDWKANATLSQNRIVDHVETPAAFDASFNPVSRLEELGDTPISFSPEIIAFNEFLFHLLDQKDDAVGLDLSLQSKYVGEQHLDNTGNEDRVLDAFLIHDIRVDVHLKSGSVKGLSLFAMMRNATDLVYASNGYAYRYFVDGNEVAFDALFPQAGRNFLLGLTLDL